MEDTPEAARQHLHSIGYSWERTRYVSNKPPDSDEEREAAQELKDSRKGIEKEIVS